jgi:transcriptional regulator with XRE-family HTH domain
MAKKTAQLLPSTDELLFQFGGRLRLARQRRRLTAKQVAERAGMTPMTLRSLERGGAGVTMGAYLSVMQVLGIENDLELIGKTDQLGRDLQDARLSATKAGLRKGLAPPPRSPSSTPVVPEPDSPERSWAPRIGFANSEKLADLFKPVLPSPKRRR